MSSKQTSWYLRKPDGSEYGPITTSDLQRWAVQCRIVAGNGVSCDRENWEKVEDIPELEMDWVAHRDNGSEYGPFNIAATRELLDHGVIAEDTTLTHKNNGKSVTVQQVLNEEDLFNEDDDEEPAVHNSDEDEELVLSEAALKEEEFYTQTQQAEAPESTKVSKSAATSKKSKEQNPEIIQKEDPEATSTTEETSDTFAENDEKPVNDPDTETEELKQELEAVKSKLQKTKDDLRQTRKELKSALQEADGSLSAITAERDQAQSSLNELQNELEELKRSHSEYIDLLAEKSSATEAELEEAVEARKRVENKLSRIETERSEAEQLSLQSVAELRKQTAFMKKNTATLQNELEKSRILASRRGRQLVVIIIVIGVIAGIMLLVGKPGCSRSEKPEAGDVEPSLPESSSSDSVQKTDNSLRPFSDIQSKTPADRVENAPPVSGDAHHSRPPSSAWPEFMIEGVKVVPSSQACSLFFDSGVFTSLITPSTTAVKQLTQIADVLRPQIDRYKIIVEGHTDDKPLRKTSTYNGNDALGLARAEAVRKLLITKGRLPAGAISARHAGGRKAPYPNNSDANRRRNRTVVIRLVRK